VVKCNIHLLTTPPPPPLEALGWAPAFIEGDLDPTLVALAEAGCKIKENGKFKHDFVENLSDKLKERAKTHTYHLGWELFSGQQDLNGAHVGECFRVIPPRQPQRSPTCSQCCQPAGVCCHSGTAEHEQKTGAAFGRKTHLQFLLFLKHIQS
jgi:hypothetical protein